MGLWKRHINQVRERTVSSVNTDKSSVADISLDMSIPNQLMLQDPVLHQLQTAEPPAQLPIFTPRLSERIRHLPDHYSPITILIILAWTFFFLTL